MSWTPDEVGPVCLPAFAPSTLLAPGIKSVGVRGRRLTKAQRRTTGNPRETERDTQSQKCRFGGWGRAPLKVVGWAGGAGGLGRSWARWAGAPSAGGPAPSLR